VPDHIPDGDYVSRHLFAPEMGSADFALLWDRVFMFKTDRNFCESVVWRKYAPAMAAVHNLGCAKQKVDRAAGKNCTYFASVTAKVERVRAIRSLTGARFEVVHAPEEGKHHAHITYAEGHALTKNDKAQLKQAIRHAFSERDDHACPD
jgi:hypothetical protein